MISTEDIEIGKIYQETPEEMKKTPCCRDEMKKSICCTEETKTNIKIICILAVVAWPIGRLILLIQGAKKYCSVCSSEGENLIIWIVGSFWIALFAMILASIVACILGIFAPLSATHD